MTEPLLPPGLGIRDYGNHFIGGEWVNLLGSRMIDLVSPNSEQVVPP